MPRRNAWLPLAVAAALLAGAARVSAEPELVNDAIEIAYVEPAAPRLRPIYADLKARRVLETLKEFLSPLVLPVTLKLTARQCDQTNAFWSGRTRGLILCYEYADWIARLAPISVTSDGFTRREMIIGEFVETALHELGHAVYDIYDVPVFGREEDAADQMAGFLMMQFGKDVARLTIDGTAASYRALAEQRVLTRSSFADEHGTNDQRFYNYLCVAYGGDPATFRHFLDAGLLPMARARNCAREYAQLANAFAKTVLPHIDRAKMRAVQSVDWIARFGR